LVLERGLTGTGCSFAGIKLAEKMGITQATINKALEHPVRQGTDQHERGNCPFRDWPDSLDPVSAARAAAYLEREKKPNMREVSCH
jgi:hypothetical protein